VTVQGLKVGVLQVSPLCKAMLSKGNLLPMEHVTVNKIKALVIIYQRIRRHKYVKRRQASVGDYIGMTLGIEICSLLGLITGRLSLVRRRGAWCRQTIRTI